MVRLVPLTKLLIIWGDRLTWTGSWGKIGSGDTTVPDGGGRSACESSLSSLQNCNHRLKPTSLLGLLGDHRGGRVAPNNGCFCRLPAYFGYQGLRDRVGLISSLHLNVMEQLIPDTPFPSTPTGRLLSL